MAQKQDDSILGLNPVLLGAVLGAGMSMVKAHASPSMLPGPEAFEESLKDLGKWSVAGAFAGAGVALFRRQLTK